MTGQRQVLTWGVLHWLQGRLPEDAFCLLGITMEDLYPEPSWNFVFGPASLNERVGVYSFARHDPAFDGEPRGKDYPALLLRRSMKVLTYEAVLPGQPTACHDASARPAFSRAAGAWFFLSGAIHWGRNALAGCEPKGTKRFPRQETDRRSWVGDSTLTCGRPLHSMTGALKYHRGRTGWNWNVVRNDHTVSCAVAVVSGEDRKPRVISRINGCIRFLPQRGGAGASRSRDGLVAIEDGLVQRRLQERFQLGPRMWAALRCWQRCSLAGRLVSMGTTFIFARVRSRLSPLRTSSSESVWTRLAALSQSLRRRI